jgi:hypothetical protein
LVANADEGTAIPAASAIASAFLDIDFIGQTPPSLDYLLISCWSSSDKKNSFFVVKSLGICTKNFEHYHANRGACQ